MSDRPAPPPKPNKPPRDPFGPPLEPSQLQGFYRRLACRPADEQQAFVARLNWNLLDAASEYWVMGWLANSLQSPDVARQVYALEVLNKLSHTRRARHAARFKCLLATLDADLAYRLADAFGPVLGGQPKRPGMGRQKPAAASQPKRPAPAATAPEGQPAVPATEASDGDLASLKAFFGKFGSAR